MTDMCGCHMQGKKGSVSLHDSMVSMMKCSATVIAILQ
jgi:hypothetical protein